MSKRTRIRRKRRQSKVYVKKKKVVAGHKLKTGRTGSVGEKKNKSKRWPKGVKPRGRASGYVSDRVPAFSPPVWWTVKRTAAP